MLHEFYIYRVVVQVDLQMVPDIGGEVTLLFFSFFAIDQKLCGISFRI